MAGGLSPGNGGQLERLGNPSGTQNKGMQK